MFKLAGINVILLLGLESVTHLYPAKDEKENVSQDQVADYVPEREYCYCVHAKEE